MIKYLFRHNKDYSRFNIIKQFTKDIKLENDIFILLPFSKNQFFKNFLKRDRIVNDFFISNYDTYVYDRKKITNKNPRAWWKYFQDLINFKFSKYILSDTNEHFKYWESLFGKFSGKHFVFPVLADRDIYFPSTSKVKNEKVRILFYGSFIPLHGIDIILNAFSLMEKKGIEFEAKIIGKGQMYPKMKDLFTKLDLKQVVMNGEIINEKELGEVIREHDIILGIFGDSVKAKSVVPNKVYQALASEKTIITMKSKAINEFFTNEDLITCDNKPKDLADELTKLINNPILIDKTSKNGYRKFTEIYNETKIKFEDFISSIDKN
ncbi:MAG: glycosyltransferase [Poseidonibacter sp.]|uniref:glycosyltransferase n=1 Tax=Poseidonibacter sp. TaxID=2321188 RepID=UPI00359D677A